ncbi:MAG: PTS sugar transporter subunit IIA [Candidatus Cloacimonetes bacterium]|nr:PTS sugar transporter subunit IIA [Candidatus Cloacimonadota bacterium]
MELSDVVKIECCDIDLKAQTKDEALLELAKLCKNNSSLQTFATESIYTALKQREALGSTGFGRGIAIPHCQLEGLREFVVGIALSRKGIPFDAIDKKKVKLLFTILGPVENRRGHLQLLAQISQILKENGMVNTLLSAKTKIGLYEDFIRNTNPSVGKIIAKGEEKLMLIIVKDDEILENITEIFIEYGIEESTIIETQQMENLLSKVPLFMGFFNFTGGKNPQSKIILLKLSKDYVNSLVKAIEEVFGDLDNFSGISLMVLDVSFAKGI